MLVDAHTHLNEDRLFVDWQGHLQEFQEVWWKILVNAWANRQYNARGIEIAEKSESLFPDLIVKATIGIHPCDVHDSFEQEVEQLEQQYVEHSKSIVAIGECGVDLHFPECADVKVQQQAFRLQAQLAEKYQLPLVIHSRDAFEETFEVLKDFSDLKIYIHSRAYDQEALVLCEKTFARLRVWANNMFCYPSAKESREAILSATTAQFLTETDAPYLPPQSLRGQTNYPKYCTFVYEKYSTLRWIPQSELEEMVYKNTLALYFNKD